MVKTHLAHLRNMAPALFALVATLAVFFGLYVAIWGWDRFKLDFWPLDASRVGPNLVASLFLVVLLIAHNEYVTEERAKTRHESHKQLVHDMVDEFAHPTEDAEAAIAAQAEEDWRKDVRDRLDETTPGGIGTIKAALDDLKPKAVR